MKTFKALVGVLATVTGLVLLSAGVITPAYATPGDTHKDYVCKYVGQPGVDERLQPSDQNPIWVDTAATAKGPTPELFNDAHRSYVIYANTERRVPEPTIADCPGFPTKPPIKIEVTDSEVPDCATKEVTITTVTTTTDWVVDKGAWVAHTDSVTSYTTRPTTSLDCPADPPKKPDIILAETHSDVPNCAAKTVTTTTVNTRTDWVLTNNVWVAHPVSVTTVTTRPTISQDCPLVTVTDPPSDPPSTGTPVTGTPVDDSLVVAGVGAVRSPAAPLVGGVGAAAPVVGGVGAAVNPLPTAASAGEADTSGQLVAGGIAGLAGFLMLGAAAVLRRRRGEV